MKDPDRIEICHSVTEARVFGVKHFAWKVWRRESRFYSHGVTPLVYDGLYARRRYGLSGKIIWSGRTLSREKAEEKVNKARRKAIEESNNVHSPKPDPAASNSVCSIIYEKDAS